MPGTVPNPMKPIVATKMSAVFLYGNNRYINPNAMNSMANNKIRVLAGFYWKTFRP